MNHLDWACDASSISFRDSPERKDGECLYDDWAAENEILGLPAEALRPASPSESSFSDCISPVVAFVGRADEPLPYGLLRTEDVTTATDLSKSARAFSDLTDPEVIVGICLNSIPAWSRLPRQCVVVSKILSGLTNQLFSVQVKEGVDEIGSGQRRVLFRIYGKDVGALYDSAFELLVFKTLSTKAIAPLLIAEFDGGRIEEWIDGVPLAVEEARTERIAIGVGRILAKLHKIHRDSDFPAGWPKGPWCVTKLQDWAEQARVIVANCQPGNPQYVAFQSLGLDKMLSQLPILRDRLVPPHCPENLATNIVFCHNDTQENNIMRVHGGDCLRLIDFEYSAFNYAGFDLANFFVECSIDYTHPVYPFYKIDETKFPSEETRKSTVAAYVSEILERPLNLSDHNLLKSVLDSIQRFILASHLVWGFWSIIRAPQAPTFEDFDYVVYAGDRFKAYSSHLARLTELGVLPS